MSAIYFVIYNRHDGSKRVMVDNDGVEMFDSETDAELAALDLSSAHKYGFEVFELGGGNYYPGYAEEE